MNNRIKLIRSKFHLSQEEFGKRVQITKTSISKIESGINNPSDQTIKLICSEFNINEEWLRTGAGGEGNMFVPEDMKYFQNVGKLGQEKNNFKKFYLNMMMGLPDEYWDYIYNEFKKFDKETKSNEIHDAKANRNPLFDGIPDTPEELEKMYPVIDMKDKKNIK